MTLGDFAAAIQSDLARMATKEDLKYLATKEDLKDVATKGDLRKIREDMATKDDVADVRDKIAVAKEELQEQIAGLRYAKEIDALRDRMKAVEEKLGIKHSHRAA